MTNQEIIEYFSRFGKFVQYNDRIYVSNVTFGEEFKGIAFDIVTQEIYCIFIKQDEYSYVWMNQESSDIIKDTIQDYFPIKEYCYTDVIDDMMEKVIGIVEGKDFEKDPMITLDFTSEDMEKLKELAEQQGITIEEVCRNLLIQFVEEYKSNVE